MNKEVFQEVCARIEKTVLVKNEAYGDSVNRAPQCLAIMCPDGIPPGKFRDAALAIRVFDKISRALAMPEGSDQENPWEDAAAYCALRAAEVEEAKQMRQATFDAAESGLISSASVMKEYDRGNK